jgi:hypothetical protein
MKAVVVITVMAFSEWMQEDRLAQLLSLLVALEFWTAKNVGKRLLQASWYVDSSTGEDRWIFEASMKVPSQTIEAIFWYSFILYGLLLLVMLALSMSMGKHSLSCAILLGLGCNIINFWAFGKIMKLRNNGTLLNMVAEVVGDSERGLEMTVQLPLLANKSTLQKKK